MERCCCEERLSETAETRPCFAGACAPSNRVINSDLPIFISVWIYLLNPFVLRWPDASGPLCF